MTKLRVLTIFGTRPEAVKMAPLVKELQRHAELIDSRVCVTAQHREMLDQVLDTFRITPDYDLNLMQPRQTLSAVARRILETFEPVIADYQPQIVLVHGDTSTTFVGALVSYYHQTMVGHVEAGLRTYDKLAPFPEEMNRQLTTRLADYHYAPTWANRANLIAERVPEDRIFVTGNTAIDAIQATTSSDYRFKVDLLNDLASRSERRLIAVTAHRRENLGEPMRQIALGLRDLAEQHADIDIVYPVHLNPAVREQVWPILEGLPNVYLLEPLEMIEMHNLMARSYMVMTDSGGLQEEAPALGKPVLVMRDVTERQEAVEAGTVLLVGPHRQRIVEEARRLLGDAAAYERMARAINPYGDGRAAQRIVQALLYSFGLAEEAPTPFGGE